MKKIITSILVFSVSAVLFAISASAKNTETVSYKYDAGRWEAHTREMEKLDRGLVAINTGSGVYLSWRLFDNEDERFGSADSNIAFNIYRGNDKIATVQDSTNYTDKTAGSSYSVAPVINGQEGEKCVAVSVQNGNYFDIPITKPADETIQYVYPYTDEYNNTTTEATYSFFPADCSTGDLDGDGEYEIVIKWTSSERDVGSPGDPAYSGTVRFSAYKLDGTKLWDNDINLGKNVYSSAHTAQFLVYDFDGDGKAEMTVQTSLGSKDSKNNYVSHAADPVSNADIYAFTDEQNAEADYRGYGRITEGEEFLTVFNGETGEAIDTINLPTSRGGIDGAQYGDDFGNRSNRFVASVAYLDGEKPYAVYLRGYYFGKNGRQRTSIAGVSFDGERLNAAYRFDTQAGQPGYYEGAYKYVGNGNHNCTVADVDGDGMDEFITGALCMEVKDDNSFKPKWCTFMEHGDALHIGDYDPTHEGFEFFTVHEDSGPNTASGTPVEISFGMSVIDPGVDADDPTSEGYKDLILFHESADADTGRGVMASTGADGYYQIWSAKNNPKKSDGGKNFSDLSFNGASQNFRIFWDGDLYDELLDGTNTRDSRNRLTPIAITGWNGNSMSNIFTVPESCVAINGTKANPSLQADLFGDWREELVYPTTDGNNLRVFTTTTPTSYKMKTLMQDPVYRMGVSAEQTAYNQPPHVGLYLADELFEAKVTGITITQMPTKTVYVTGENLDLSGLVVTASRDDGTSSPTSLYSLSDFDSSTPGEKTITITCDGNTAEFKVTVLAVTGISVTPPSKTTYSMGQQLNTNGMTVTAAYSNGSSGIVAVSDCTITGFNSSEVGDCTVTVNYYGQTATFKATIIEGGQITLINSTYETDSTTSDSEITEIGLYGGSFTLEHDVVINSMPANGSPNDKRSETGFYIRFMNCDSGNTVHTGSGWTLVSSNGKPQLYWKDTGGTTLGTLEIGKKYRFKYAFTDVGTGSGAYVTLTVTDEGGNIVVNQSGLRIRNFTDTPTGKLSYINSVQIYNQANADSPASITIDNAKVYGTCSSLTADGNTITYSTNGIGNGEIYAAKYSSDGLLTNIQKIKLKALGENITAETTFEPDKVFLWTYDMYPIAVWEKN